MCILYQVRLRFIFTYFRTKLSKPARNNDDWQLSSCALNFANVHLFFNQKHPDITSMVPTKTLLPEHQPSSAGLNPIKASQPSSYYSVSFSFTIKQYRYLLIFFKTCTCIYFKLLYNYMYIKQNKKQIWIKDMSTMPNSIGHFTPSITLS